MNVAQRLSVNSIAPYPEGQYATALRRTGLVAADLGAALKIRNRRSPLRDGRTVKIELDQVA